MFLRALAAFLVLPGTIAFLVPILVLVLTGNFQLVQPTGLLVMALGIVLLLACVWEFYTSGKGTLAPWAPPRQLVTGGLYRFSRNPMYVAVLLILLGWAVTAWYWPLLVYAGLVAVGFHLRIVRAEEPWLAREFGEAWERYVAKTRRWV